MTKVTAESLTKRIKYGLELISKAENNDERTSLPFRSWGTVYIVNSLKTARRKGISIPPEIAEQGRTAASRNLVATNNYLEARGFKPKNLP